MVAGPACQGRRIRAEYQARFARLPPRPEPVPCDDTAARVDRDYALAKLVEDAARVRQRFDDPLPPPLAERLARVDLTHARDDWACFVRDRRARVPAVLHLGQLATLLFERAEREAAADSELAWRHVADALAIYASPDPYTYLYYFQPAYFFARAERLAGAHPPSERAAAELRRSIDTATLSRDSLCAGFREEYMVQGGVAFAGYLTALKEPMLDRWGQELSPLLDDKDYVERSRPSLGAWRAWNGFFEPLLARCGSDEPIDRVAADVLSALAPLQAAAPRLAVVAQAAGERIQLFPKVQLAAQSLRARLVSRRP
jgi:hypothetical protein